jgi:osomolarity two-component system sensor histidine kinase TcsA
MGPVFNECCPFLITDKHWMTENILTLLSNACKFTSKGEIVLRISIVVKNIPGKMVRGFSNLSNSVVTFDTTLDPEKHATAEWMADNPSEEYEVRIEVEDSGIGVQDDAVQNLFRPFGQCQRRAGGTGLGLFSLSKRTEVLNGRCGMHRRVDGGSGCFFWFTFPYLPDSNCWNDGITTSEPGSTISTHKPEGNAVTSLQTKAQLELLQKSGSRRRSAEIFCKRDDAKTSSNVVLVVDDSALILKTTSRMLVKEGFEVETAQNGVEGLQLMRSNSYFFVLSDIQMPIMDGLEMAQRIRQIEKDEDKHPHHIVGMSANSDAETRDDSLASGMNAFIPKPVRVNELLNHLVTMATS